MELNNGLIREFNLVKDYCKKNNIRTELISKKHIQRNFVLLERDCVVLGTVEGCHEVFKYFNVAIPKIDSYPSELRPYLLRDVQKIKLSQVHEGYSGFIKPAEDLKKWTGFVIRDPGEFRLLASHSKNTMVYISPPVKFVSEWRYYVINKRIVAKGNYDGDEKIQCNIKIVEEAVNKTNSNTFCIDFGVLDDGSTALVEYNDAYAVGWYLDNNANIYFDLISTRFKELLNI